MEEEASSAPGAYRNSLMSKVRNHRRNFDQLRRDLVRLNCLNSNIVSVVDLKNILQILYHFFLIQAKPSGQVNVSFGREELFDSDPMVS